MPFCSGERAAGSVSFTKFRSVILITSRLPCSRYKLYREGGLSNCRVGKWSAGLRPGEVLEFFGRAGSEIGARFPSLPSFARHSTLDTLAGTHLSSLSAQL